jgi:hypothetical protein
LIATAPGATTEIFAARSDNALFRVVGFRLTASRTLELYNFEDSAAVGSASSALDLNTWYRIELKVDTTTLATTALEGLVNGVSFASGTVNLANAQSSIQFGVISTSVTTDLYFDDIAINDSSGSFQNSWPGEGSIVHLRPSATGDNSDWTGDNTDIDEVTPDDTTTKISSNTTSQIEDVNIDATPSAMDSNAIINVVSVGCRFNGAGASANATFAVRVKASTNDTVESSSNITPANATWFTNAIAVPYIYPLTLYNLPSTSLQPWRKADLDSAQIGVNLVASSTNAAQVSTLWMLVEYRNRGIGLHNTQKYLQVGNGESRSESAK